MTTAGAFFWAIPAGAQAPGYNDSWQRSLYLPHDWGTEDLPALPAADPADAVSGTWRFHRGDNPSWKDETVDESDGETIRLPDTGEGVRGAPKTMCMTGAGGGLVVYEKYREAGLTLGLGMIDDVDGTFSDGVRIGGTVSFAADYQSACEVLRLYRVPPEIIRCRRENLITARGCLTLPAAAGSAARPRRSSALGPSTQTLRGRRLRTHAWRHRMVSQDLRAAAVHAPQARPPSA